MLLKSPRGRAGGRDPAGSALTARSATMVQLEQVEPLCGQRRTKRGQRAEVLMKDPQMRSRTTTPLLTPSGSELGRNQTFCLRTELKGKRSKPGGESEDGTIKRSESH